MSVVVFMFVCIFECLIASPWATSTLTYEHGDLMHRNMPICLKNLNSLSQSAATRSTNTIDHIITDLTQLEFVLSLSRASCIDSWTDLQPQWKGLLERCVNHWSYWLFWTSKTYFSSSLAATYKINRPHLPRIWKWHESSHEDAKKGYYFSRIENAASNPKHLWNSIELAFWHICPVNRNGVMLSCEISNAFTHYFWLVNRKR